MEKQNEREEVEIKENTNIKVLQETFEFYGFQLESVKIINNKMMATFVKE